MYTAYYIFIRAVGLYLLFTLPALAEPVMYLFSALLAIIYGLAAGFVFVVCYILISLTQISYEFKRASLFLAVVAGVTVSYMLIGYFDTVEELWGYNPFIIFPSVAVIAGWSSLFISRKELRENLTPQTNNTNKN